MSRRPYWVSQFFTSQHDPALARRVSQYLRVQSLPSIRTPRLDSIRSRILTLAVLGTLVPAAITLGIAYAQNHRALEKRITEDLHSESSQTSGAISVFIKERIFDLRVFASSDEVSSNLSRFATGQGSIPSARLREYLRSLHGRFADFDDMLVLDAQGRVMASSSEQSRPVRLPDEWQSALRRDNQLIGAAYWDERASKGKLLVAVPVQRADGRFLGAFAAELNLEPIQAQLRSFQEDTGTAGSVLLATENGRLIASSTGVTRDLLNSSLRADLLLRLLAREHEAVEYSSMAGSDVIGTLEHVPQLPWLVIAEKNTDDAFHAVTQFRNFGVLVMLLVLSVVAATAYRLGVIIVRPLEHLATGAAEVAMGDLDVDLPSADTAGEVSALTRVFNHMVGRLREKRKELAATNAELRFKNEELEKLSVTDGLTGLVNHRALMQRLADEATRSKRTERPFAVIMADVDHFKQYNDTFGHPAGDEVLKGIAAILKDATRTVDCVARYGGEEFAILLPETELDGAMEVAERIRASVESGKFTGRQMTLSIGVAVFPKDAPDTAGIIKVADEALYVAKGAGRNQVVQAKRARKQKLPTAASARARKKPATRKKR